MFVIYSSAYPDVSRVGPENVEANCKVQVGSVGLVDVWKVHVAAVVAELELAQAGRAGIHGGVLGGIIHARITVGCRCSPRDQDCYGEECFECGIGLHCYNILRS